MRTLAIGNIAEFNESTRREVFSPPERESWLRASDELTDMAAFWGGSNKVMLVPPTVDRGWLEHVCERMAWTIEVVEPARVSGLVVQDALIDSATLKRLAELLGGGAALAPWGMTANVLRLNAALQALGVETEFLAPAPRDLWSVRYLDGKLALMDLATWLPDLRVPAGYTAVNFEHCLGLVGMMVRARTGFVVKSNVGVGGFGTFIGAAEGELGDEERALRALHEAIDGEPMFREGPLLVQEYVHSAEATLRPTYDGFVHGPDDVRDVGVGGMLVDGTSYRGVVVGEVPLPGEALVEAKRIGRAVGRVAGALGFRGWYDVDYVLSDSGTMIATEVNARRTSPAHAFAALERWREHDPRIGCVVADDHVPVGEEAATTWKAVAPVFESMRGDGVRCAATIVRTLANPHPTVGAVIGATTHADAEAARRELTQRLTRSS